MPICENPPVNIQYKTLKSFYYMVKSDRTKTASATTTKF